jgi:hypothetical protein
MMRERRRTAGDVNEARGSAGMVSGCDPDAITVLVHSLAREPLPSLRTRYEALWKERCRSNNRDFLIKRIVWKTQEVAQGGLSERARQRARELMSDAPFRVRMPKAEPARELIRGETIRAKFEVGGPILVPGSVLRREYKGREIVVRVLPKGFEYRGSIYRSLSAIANEITGSHWNGQRFFGVATERSPRGDA